MHGPGGRDEGPINMLIAQYSYKIKLPYFEWSNFKFGPLIELIPKI